MHTFEIFVTLKSGYVPVISTEVVNEIRIYIEAPNRVTAKRMAHAMFDDNQNVTDYDVICCDGCCDIKHA